MDGYYHVYMEHNIMIDTLIVDVSTYSPRNKFDRLNGLVRSCDTLIIRGTYRRYYEPIDIVYLEKLLWNPIL